MRSKRKRHPITLLEIMIVILLIGVIGGVLSYNLKGTLDRGKKFRTDEGIKRLKEILNLEIEGGNTRILKRLTTEKIMSSDAAVKRWVRDSLFIPESNLEEFLMDGWKEPYIISLDKDGELAIHSRRFEAMK